MQVIGNEWIYELSGQKKLKSTHTPFHRSATRNVERVGHATHSDDALSVIENEAGNLDVCEQPEN